MLALRLCLAGIRAILVYRYFVLRRLETTIYDKYEVLEEEVLGRGNFSRVVKARHRVSQRMYAVKVVEKGLEEEAEREAERVRQEVELLRHCAHAHVIGVVEVFDSQERSHVVLELMQGDLLEMMQEGRWEEERAREVVKQVGEAVAHLHRRGVVHRDLKPENVLVGEGEALTVKLADFGFARHVTEEARLLTPCGTPGYAAPEIGAQSYTQGVDLWSLGVVLYTLLAGFPPFYAADESVLLQQVAEGRIYFPRAQWQHVSHQAIHLVRRLLDRNAEERISAEELLQHPWITGRKAESEMAAVLDEVRVEEADRMEEGRAMRVRTALNRSIDAHRDGFLTRSSTESSIVRRRQKRLETRRASADKMEWRKEQEW